MQALAPIAAPLLAWYHQNRRRLPFREDPSPYHIWVSEIMLQQTRVSAALPYYLRWMRQLPTIADLAACDEQKLHKLWEGLGYYSRVRNLQKAAKIVVAQHGGRLPASYEALCGLPGIGAYTAGAIASIAFGLPQVAVDGNVLRVFSRLLACEEDVTKPATKQLLTAEVRRQQPQAHPGDFNQAVMELGALVCLPGAPACPGCPLAGLCRGHRLGVAARLPYKAPKKPKQSLHVCVAVAWMEEKVLLQQRPKRGLLAGLWQPVVLAEGAVLSHRQAQAALQEMFPGARLGAALPEAAHVFTHKVWQLYGWQAQVAPGSSLPPGIVAATPAQIQHSYPVPSAFKAYLPHMGL